MNLILIENLAKSMMKDHGLNDWRFEFDRSKSRLGCCKYSEKVISLSKFLSPLREERFIKDTILHEIAHALVGPKHGHNDIWRRKAISIGCLGNRCSSDIQIEGKYKSVCKFCNTTQTYHRLPKRERSCGVCYPHAYNPHYKIEIILNK